MKVIDEYAIPILIFQRDNRMNSWAHIRQVEELLDLYPDRWRLIARSGNGPSEVSVFEIKENAKKDSPVQKLILLTEPRSLPRS
jgi:hypothetical protein